MCNLLKVKYLKALLINEHFSGVTVVPMAQGTRIHTGCRSNNLEQFHSTKRIPNTYFKCHCQATCQMVNLAVSIYLSMCLPVRLSVFSQNTSYLY